LGQGNSTSRIRSAIEYGGYPNADTTPSSLYVGLALSGDPGNKGSSVFDAVAARSNQDPDQTSTTWAQYKATATGNGRRIITVPIHDWTQMTGKGTNVPYPVIGFANFLLDLSANIKGNSGAICGTYIGPGSLNGGTSAGTSGTNFYKNTLYQ
jgi:hypothetical protein